MTDLHSPRMPCQLDRVVLVVWCNGLSVALKEMGGRVKVLTIMIEGKGSTLGSMQALIS